MMDQVYHESGLLLYSFLLGIGMAACYDLFLILRKVLPHNRLLTAMEDFIFLAVCTMAVLFTFHEKNDGILRWYVFAGILVGLVLYKITISQYFVWIMSTILKKTIHVVVKTLKIILTPFKASIHATSKMFQKIKKILKKPLKKAKTRLTVCIKQFTIKLCKHQKEGEDHSRKKQSKNPS